MDAPGCSWEELGGAGLEQEAGEELRSVGWLAVGHSGLVVFW
jgi:hypothetical protein